MALAKQGTNVERRDAHAKGIAQAERFPIVSMVLLALTFVGMMISIWMIFLYAPTDAIEGDAQRIFYFHLPTAIIGMLAFGIVTIGGIMYLWKKEERWDWAARAAAELGAVFLTFALITGSIWGRTLHPQQVLPIGSSPQLPPEMLYTLLVSFITLTLLFSFLMVQLYQLEKMQTLAQRLRASVE